MSKVEIGLIIYGIGSFIFLVIYGRRVTIDYLDMVKDRKAGYKSNNSLWKILKHRGIWLAIFFTMLSWLTVIAMAYFYSEDKMIKKRKKRQNISEQLNSISAE